MGIKLAVKKAVVPACGSYGSIAAAIADPFQIAESYPSTSDGKADAGEYCAIQYNDLGFDAGSTYFFEAYNVSDPSAAMTIYTINHEGSVVDSYVSSDGVVEVGDANLERPYYESPESTFVVIQNVGGDSCDNFEFRYVEAT